MYIAYARHNIRPSEYYRMSPSERIIIRAFTLKEKEEIDNARKGG